MEEKKQQALISAVQQAQAQAEMEKKSRKIQKLIPIPADNESHTPVKKANEEINASSLPSHIEERLKIDGEICV